VELEAGRKRPYLNAPRTLDLDLIFFGNRIVRKPGLTIPHPRWKNRSFVVRPLRSLAPGIIDPETGLTVEEVERLWSQEPHEIRESSQRLDLAWMDGMERERI
jgi:7,8-dihydro-6-hydroxymethylpterin-pyrophosphokinase